MRRRIAHGDLPAYRCGRLIRVDPDDVDRMMVRIPTARGVSPAVERGEAWAVSNAVHSAQQSQH
jgi:hypothetical protein